MQLYTVTQRNLLLLGAVLVIVGSFLPWEIEGDFLPIRRYGIQLFPAFADHGGVLVSLISILIIGLVFYSEGFVKSPAKWVLTSATALFIIFAYHIVDWLVRRIDAYGMIGAPAITIGLVLVGIGSILLLTTAFFVNSKALAKYVQE